MNSRRLRPRSLALLDMDASFSETRLPPKPPCEHDETNRDTIEIPWQDQHEKHAPAPGYWGHNDVRTPRRVAERRRGCGLHDVVCAHIYRRGPEQSSLHPGCGRHRTRVDTRGVCSQLVKRSIRRLANQRALPDTEQQRFELGEMPDSELSVPLAFDVAEDIVDLRVSGASSFGQADNSRASFIGCVGPGEIPEGFEAPQELVHSLLAHAGALGKHPRADPIRARKLQHRHMRHAELVEAGGVELLDDPAVNSLRRNAE